MRSPIHAFFAILAAILTFIAVFAIKRGVELETADLSTSTLGLLVAIMLSIFAAMAAWTYLLRPMIVRRKQAKDAGLSERAVRDRPVD